MLGFCIGGPFIWNLLKRAPGRVVAAVLAQPSGFRPEMPDLFYQNNIKGWGPALCERRPDVTMAMVDAFLNKMYRTNADFVFTVTRDFVRDCQTPILVLPDDVPAHPYAVAMESAHARAQCTGQPLSVEGNPEQIPLAVRHVRAFLQSKPPGECGATTAGCRRAIAASPSYSPGSSRGRDAMRGTRFDCLALIARWALWHRSHISRRGRCEKRSRF